MIGRALTWIVMALLGLLVPSQPAVAADGSLTADDLLAYERALGVADDDGSPSPATFHDLWDRPESFQGKRVRVEGRVVRRFHQGASPQFPALLEVWLVNHANDPICVVMPEPTSPLTDGATLAFTGTFLRRVTYRAGDTARLAPLVVGPGPGVSLGSAGTNPAATSGMGWSMSPTEWTVAGLVALGTLAILLRQHLRQPLPVRGICPEPDPLFVDGEPDPTEPGGSPR